MCSALLHPTLPVSLTVAGPFISKSIYGWAWDRDQDQGWDQKYEGTGSKDRLQVWSWTRTGTGTMTKNETIICNKKRKTIKLNCYSKL